MRRGGEGVGGGGGGGAGVGLNLLRAGWLGGGVPVLFVLQSSMAAEGTVHIASASITAHVHSARPMMNHSMVLPGLTPRTHGSQLPVVAGLLGGAKVRHSCHGAPCFLVIMCPLMFSEGAG